MHVCVCVQVNSDGEAMVEVVDGWLARLYPNTPTWREIADVAEQIGHHQLSQSIKQVYVTGGGRESCSINNCIGYISTFCSAHAHV